MWRVGYARRIEIMWKVICPCNSAKIMSVNIEVEADPVAWVNMEGRVFI